MEPIDDAMEAEFALRRRHPEREQIYADHLRRGALLRARGGCRLDLRYGDEPRCRLDLFAAGDHAPVLFFIHGGYWRALDKAYVSFIAEPYQRAGISVVMPSYELVPDVAIADIMAQIRNALAWTMAELQPAGVVVAGHSAGGQLAAMLALDQAENGCGPIKALVGVSGVFDLRPLLRTSINRDLGLSLQDAEAASPQLRLAALPANAALVPLLGVVGGDETSGFKRWTSDFVTTWKSRGGKACAIEIAGRTHFTILDVLAEPDSEIWISICRLAKPGTGSDNR